MTEHEIDRPSFVRADWRGVLSVGGADARAFLQGLVSNDVDKVGEARAIYAALLTPQGRYLHDFFLANGADGSLLLECEGERRQDLAKRLAVYRLRAKVTIAEPTPSLVVVLLFGSEAADRLGLPAEAGRARSWAGGVAFVDPRLPALGIRAVLPREQAEAAAREAGFAAASAVAYDRLRLALGVPEGSRDLEVEKALLLENGFDALNGIDWAKGCYVGQELTARMKYRALVKRSLVPVPIMAAAPAP